MTADTRGSPRALSKPASSAPSSAVAPNATDTMTIDQIERWISNHIKPKR